MDIPAISLRDVRRLCNPRPLRADELAEFYVETDGGRDPHQSIRQTIRTIFDETEGSQRILVYGHRGSGKSTELTKLAEGLGAQWMVVAFSIKDDLPPLGIRAEELLLALAYRLVEKAHHAQPLLKIDESRLEQVLDFFRAAKVETTKRRDSAVTVEGGAKAGTGAALVGLFDLFFTYRNEVKLATGRVETAVEHLRKRPADLVAQINALIRSITEALQKEGRRLLLIVEDLDKLTIADARSVFVDNAQMLASIQTNVIYTIPIFTFYSPDASAMTAVFDHDFGFPMLKVSDFCGNRAEGFELVREIVLRRVDKSAITTVALDLLIQKTGGVLRHVFDVLQTVTTMTSLREPPIEESHIRYGLNRLKADLGTQIALPDPRPEGLTEVKQLYDKLADFEKRRREFKPCPPVGDPVVQILLRCCALVEYNGERWLGVHPLVVEFLKEIGYTFT